MSFELGQGSWELLPCKRQSHSRVYVLYSFGTEAEAFRGGARLPDDGATVSEGSFSTNGMVGG